MASTSGACQPTLPGPWGTEEAAGSDDEAMTISRIRAIEKLLSWYDKCLPCLAYEGPQVPPKEELERVLKDLKRQLKQIKDADRNGG